MKKKILFIVNPVAGNNNKKHIEKQILLNIDRKIFTPFLKFTKTNKDAAIFTKKAEKENYYCIVAVGGDGTINEVASLLIDSSTLLAIIPLGSGNGFANYFKIYSNIKKTLKLINTMNYIKIDACFLNKKPFFNLAGLGFSSNIAHKTHHFKKRGVWIYIIAIIKEFLKYKSTTYTLKIDENKPHVKKFFLLEFANASFWGKGINIAPLANPSDGKIDVCGITPFPFWKIPYLLFLAITKNINKSSHYCRLQGKKINVLSNHSAAHIDGEAININNPIKIRIKHSAVSLIAPKQMPLI